MTMWYGANNGYRVHFPEMAEVVLTSTNLPQSIGLMRTQAERMKAKDIQASKYPLTRDVRSGRADEE